MSEDIHSLSHTKWNCKYHVVFAPKFRRKVFFGEKRAEIGQILRQLCEWKGVNIREAESHTYVDRDTPENERIKFHGISEGKKQPDDIREVGKHEVQVPEP